VTPERTSYLQRLLWQVAIVLNAVLAVFQIATIAAWVRGLGNTGITRMDLRDVLALGFALAPITAVISMLWPPAPPATIEKSS